MERIYGASDDLVEFEGNIVGEVGCFGTDDRDYGVLVMCSDGTVLEVKYGKGQAGIWAITLLKKGKLFKEIIQCDDEDAKIYSDIAVFNDGITWIYAATKWELVN